MTKFIFSLMLLGMSRTGVCAPAIPNDINRLLSPVIEGDTLYIQGDIETHIYDAISRAAKEMRTVTTIDLNSNGGDVLAALDLAEKIQTLHITTRISQGSVCASSCLLLFAAGQQRVAHQSVWFGVHNVRLEVSLAETFYRRCGGDKGYSQDHACAEFVSKWRPKLQAATKYFFAALEKMGVSPELQANYESLSDDPQWFENRNVLRKPDYVLTAQDALRFNLVTQIEPVVTAGVSPP